MGIIPLSSIIDALQTDPVSKHKQYCLRIVTAKRSFVCCAPDEDTLLLWLDAIHVECERVAQESRREQDGEDLLSDPRAMGRVTHMNAAQGGAGAVPIVGGAIPRSGSRSGLAPAAVSSSIQSTGSQLKKVLSQESGSEAGGGSGPSVSFSTSPAIGGPLLAPHAAGSNLSSSFATSPSRSYHTPEGPTRPTTVTFST